MSPLDHKHPIFISYLSLSVLGIEREFPNSASNGSREFTVPWVWKIGKSVYTTLCIREHLSLHKQPIAQRHLVLARGASLFVLFAGDGALTGCWLPGELVGIGGPIGVDSDIGKGTRFRVVPPLVAAEEST
jgi:hypothetical protein